MSDIFGLTTRFSGVSNLTVLWHAGFCLSHDREWSKGTILCVPALEVTDMARRL